MDLGANRSYVSTTISDWLPKHRQRKEHPYPLTLADGKPVEENGGRITEELTNVTLAIGTHHELRTFDIVQMQYDMVLGMDWLQEHNPEVD